MGLLPAVLMTAADVDDATAAPELFACLEGLPSGKVARMYDDSNYHSFKLCARVEANARLGLRIILRPGGK